MVGQQPEQPAQPQARQNDSSELTLSDLITGRRPKPTAAQQIGRAFTMAGRNVVHGLASIPGVINDPIVNTLNYAEDKLGIDPKYRFGTAGQAADYVLNKAGVPDYQPQNGTERVVGRIEEGLGGLAGGAGLGSVLGRSANATTQGIGNALKESLGKQTIATVGGTAGGGITHEAGGGPKTELAISLLGGLSPLAAEGAITGATKGLARLFGNPDAQTSRLAKIAQDHGIPLKASQISDSRTAKLLDSATGQVPFSGSAKFQASQQEAFNNAVGRTIGVNEKAITPEVFDRAKATIGRQFDTLAERNNMQITPELIQKLNALRGEVAATGNQEAVTAIDKQFERIINQQQNSELPGAAYKSLYSELGRMASGGANPDKAHYAAQMRELLGEAMDASISPQDVQAWALARRQYRNLKDIEPLVAEASANGGNISPAKLLGRVMANKAGKSSVAQGKRGELADLAAIGRRFIKEQVPDSGTARRTAVVDALKGLGTVAGSAVGTGAALNPLAGLVAGGSAVAISRKVQNILRNPRLVNTLLKNPNLDPTLRKALEASINPSLQSLPPAANGSRP
ncbi:hypothetical protein [Frateuria sp.]|uniref:hypothetical protein n=1 Tax=Frateuria sp. TaxID=2211372 RepID=UPI003F80EF9E